MTTTLTTPLTGAWVADQGHSSFTASARHMGVGTFKTSFEEVEARVTESDGRLELYGEARVESISIRTPKDLRTHVVEGEDFFDANNHPTIEFRSGDVSIAEDGSVSLAGELTIKDDTRRVSATGELRGPVVGLGDRNIASLDLATTIDRREFGLSWQAPLPKGGEALGWEVEIAVHLELVQE